MSKCLSLLPLSFLFASASFGASHVTKTIAQNVKVYTDVCEKKDCGIKKVRFETKDYSISEPEDLYPYYGTLAYFGFEAKSWADLTKYGFVQQIRGCTYQSKQNSDGTISKRIGESIMHLGKKRTYVFPGWSYDATSKDPLYYGPNEEDANLPGGRLSLYRWTPKLGVIDKKLTKDLYEVLRLPETKRKNLSPSVFVTDSPSMAYLQSEEDKVFQNVSLEFKMCLYEMKDIPLMIETDDQLNMEPIVCHTWNSQFEFDFAKNKFVNLPNKGLDPFCASQIPRNPADVFKEEIKEEENK